MAKPTLVPDTILSARDRTLLQTAICFGLKSEPSQL